MICMRVRVKSKHSHSHRSSPLSHGGIVSPRAQDSALSLRVTHGAAAPCPQRSEGISALSVSVTAALSPVMPSRWQAEGSGGLGGVLEHHQQWQTDMWQVKPTNPSVRMYSGVVQVCVSTSVCLHTIIWMRPASHLKHIFSSNTAQKIKKGSFPIMSNVTLASLDVVQ